ncbi:MAG: hypothetical protein WC867_06940 [Candidatus Pacearchaeota archaeon]
MKKKNLLSLVVFLVLNILVITSVSAVVNPPIVESVSPNDGMITKNPLFICNVTSNSAALSLISISIWDSEGQLVNHSIVNFLTPVLSNVSTWAYSFSRSGNYTWNCYSEDSLGNGAWSIQGNKTLIYDITNPSLKINSPFNNQKFATKSLSLEFSSTDSTKFNHSIAGVYNSLNNIENSNISYLSGDQTIPFDINQDGNYSLRVNSYDFIGNSNSSFVNIIVDTTKPEITKKSPINGSTYYTNQSIIIYFDAIDLTSVKKWWSDGSSNYSLDIANNISYTSAGNYNIIIYANDSLGNLASETVSFFVIDMPQNKYLEKESSSYVVSGNIEEIVYSYQSQLQNVNVPSTLSSKNILIDFSQILNNGELTLSQNSLTLTREDSSLNHVLIFNSGTRIISNILNWDGKLNLPFISSESVSVPNSGSLEILLNMGASSELNLSIPAKIILAGKAGKKAAWKKGSSSSLTEISVLCDSITLPTNINSNYPRECYTNIGTDLVIFTYHLSDFAAFNPTSVPVNPSSDEEEVSSTSSPAGSAGGNMGFVLHYPNYTEIREGFSRSLKAGDRFRVNISGENHFVIVDKVDTNFVVVNMSPKFQQTVITLNEFKKFDINLDETLDFSLKLNSVISNRAGLTIKHLDEKVNIPTKEKEDSSQKNSAGEYATNVPTARVIDSSSLSKSTGAYGLNSEITKKKTGLSFFLWAFITSMLLVAGFATTSHYVQVRKKKIASGESKKFSFSWSNLFKRDKSITPINNLPRKNYFSFYFPFFKHKEKQESLNNWELANVVKS